MVSAVSAGIQITERRPAAAPCQERPVGRKSSDTLETLAF
jgi:hypothetical protein